MDAGCSRVQTVTECVGSWCRMFKSVQAVGAGCSGVCRQWVQAVQECAGSSCILFKSEQVIVGSCSRVCRQCAQAKTEKRQFHSVQAVGAC